MREYLLVFLVAAATTYLLTVIAREIALRTGAVAKVRDRDVHAVPIPYLGGLAMLHAHRRVPELFGALVLQSGSFFDVEIDGQESSYRWFDRITAFVREVATGPSTFRTPIPIAITCGTGEENLANNRAMARALGAQGYPVTFHERRDGHNWICWRDLLDVAFTAVRRGGRSR